MQVWGSNTLHVESIPGLGDFHPLELSYGQLCRFWGNQCHHYTIANRTDSTRVSFDFRVIPRSLYTGAFDGYIGDYPTRIARGVHANDAERHFERALEILQIDGKCVADKCSAVNSDCCFNIDLWVKGQECPVQASIIAEAQQDLETAAKLGHMAAVALCLDFGLGRAKDEGRAGALLLLDATQGLASAQHVLAVRLWANAVSATLPRGSGNSGKVDEETKRIDNMVATKNDKKEGGADQEEKGKIDKTETTKSDKDGKEEMETGARAAVRWWRKAAKQRHHVASLCLARYGDGGSVGKGSEASKGEMPRLEDAGGAKQRVEDGAKDPPGYRRA
jgi:hypothetical protein